MKKIISVLFGLGIAAAASAATPTSASLVNAQGLYWVPVAPLYYTNFIGGGTNSIASTNVSVSQVTNAVGLATNWGPFVDAPIWGDLNGNAGALNVSVTTVADHVKGTNAFNVVLGRVADGVNASTATADQFTFLVTPNPIGTVAATMATNLPTQFVTGTQRIRVVSVTTTGSTTYGSNISLTISVNGYKP